MARKHLRSKYICNADKRLSVITDRCSDQLIDNPCSDYKLKDETGDSHGLTEKPSGKQEMSCHYQ
ncbi:MAG: hypothetical protein Q4E63_05080 [Prevotellaceae bacterium]|nr:hypothetical protein [Prevotellaceae bacterium]